MFSVIPSPPPSPDQSFWPNGKKNSIICTKVHLGIVSFPFLVFLVFFIFGQNNLYWIRNVVVDESTTAVADTGRACTVNVYASKRNDSGLNRRTHTHAYTYIHRSSLHEPWNRSMSLITYNFLSVFPSTSLSFVRLRFPNCIFAWFDRQKCDWKWKIKFRVLAVTQSNEMITIVEVNWDDDDDENGKYGLWIRIHARQHFSHVIRLGHSLHALVYSQQLLSQN